MKKMLFVLSVLSITFLSGCEYVTIGHNRASFENSKTVLGVAKLDDSANPSDIHIRANAKSKTGSMPNFEASVTKVSDSESQLDVYVKNN